MAATFTTPEKSFPTEFYQKLTWAPKGAEKMKKSRALSFQSSNGDQTPTSSCHQQQQQQIQPVCLNFESTEKLEQLEPQIPPSPPRKPLSTEFLQQLLQAPKRPTLSTQQQSEGRYSLPAQSNVSNNTFHNRSCITFSV
uniref:Uncharacterized protein n=1 Tax=Panagrolaimus superbus TaxID=310955 RepID=A0A914ZER1_9BILA